MPISPNAKAKNESTPKAKASDPSFTGKGSTPIVDHSTKLNQTMAGNRVYLAGGASNYGANDSKTYSR